MGYLLILAKTVSNISEGVFIKKYNEKYSGGGMFFTGIVSLFAMAFFFVSDTGGLNFVAAMLPYAAAFGIVYAATCFLSFLSFAWGSFALSMLVLSYSLAFPVLYGIIILNESVTAFTCAGFILLAVSLFLVRGEKKSDEKRASGKWIAAITAACVGNGMLAMLQKVVQLEFDNTCNNEFMASGLALSAASLIVCGLVNDRKNLKYILRHGTLYAAATGTANGLTNLLSIFINNLVPLAVSSPLFTGAKIVLSFVSSFFIFREKYIRRQLIGVALGTAALVLVNL